MIFCGRLLTINAPGCEAANAKPETALLYTFLQRLVATISSCWTTKKARVDGYPPTACVVPTSVSHRKVQLDDNAGVRTPIKQFENPSYSLLRQRLLSWHAGDLDDGTENLPQ